MNTNTEEDFNLALGRRLIVLRQSQKMSQDHLGELLGVSSQQIYKYETGENRMSPERIHACASIFKVPVGYFYGEDETGQMQERLDKDILTMASEILGLPPSIRKGVFNLSQIINKEFPASMRKEKKGQAA